MISYQVTYFIKYLRYISAIFFIGVAFFFGIFFFVMNQMIIDFSSLNVYNAGKPSILLDDEGNEWARFQIDYREPVALENLPPHLIQAFIAAEDWQFFSHTGISIKGIIRSTLVNIYHGRKMQGASTITQQLVKLIFFNSKKTFKRKLLEQLYAVLI
ncbi:MAG: transglycosylase domain-containing protein, partial [Candidatus Dependentiae bacterium]|nr:transglycosylase domain-containing protein [Candidatus Dependentiae bacterium]